MIVSRSGTIFPPHPDLFIGNISLNSCNLKFLVLCVIASLLLGGISIPFLHQLLKRLVYLGNLPGLLGIKMSY